MSQINRKQSCLRFRYESGCVNIIKNCGENPSNSNENPTDGRGLGTKEERGSMMDDVQSMLRSASGRTRRKLPPRELFFFLFSLSLSFSLFLFLSSLFVVSPTRQIMLLILFISRLLRLPRTFSDSVDTLAYSKSRPRPNR